MERIDQGQRPNGIDSQRLFVRHGVGESDGVGRDVHLGCPRAFPSDGSPEARSLCSDCRRLGTGSDHCCEPGMEPFENMSQARIENGHGTRAVRGKYLDE